MIFNFGNNTYIVYVKYFFSRNINMSLYMKTYSSLYILARGSLTRRSSYWGVFGINKFANPVLVNYAAR